MGNISFEHLYTIGNYITFNICVESGSFSGASNFCISESSLKNAISALSEMHNTMKGSYKILDNESDDFLNFEFISLGHIIFSGQIGGSYNQQYLKYHFISDQTYLNNIILKFKSMIF